MSSGQNSTFDHEATLEELAGVGKNRRFDEVLDAEEDTGIEVVCRLAGKEIPLAKPSRAFYFGDRELYLQEAKRFDQGERSRILNTDQFPENAQVLDELKRACERGFVIPFVGAGMSKGAGLPEWKDYLLDLCGKVKLSKDSVRERLEDGGDYEGVMNDIIEGMKLNLFERNFERTFKIPDIIEGPVAALPQLFDGVVITTNFDRVLEKAYENCSVPFTEKVTGLGRTNAFFRSIPAGERYLMKLHGNVDNAAERVLSRSEYAKAYGDSGDIDLDRPLPKTLRRLFMSYSLLFLGCSLSADRTLATFTKVAQLEGPDSLPHHYALLPCPPDEAKRQTMDQRLADAHITPLWYPDGEHEHVEEILGLLID
jgi:hypothetical protein